MATHNSLSDKEIDSRVDGSNEGSNLCSHDRRVPDNDSMQEPVTSNALYFLCDVISRHRGIVYGTAAGVLAGLQMGTVGWLRSSISPYEIMFCRGIIFLVSVASVSWSAGADYTAADMALYFGYGVTNSLGILAGYVALQFTHLGNATAITFNLPIPTTILGFFIFNEGIAFYDILLFAINVVGIVLVAKPPFLFGIEGDSEGMNEFLGAILAVIALLCIVMSIIISRKLSYREHADPALATVVSGMVSILLTSCILLYTQTWDTPSTFLETVAIPLAGIFGFFANLSIVYALKYERVLTVSVLDTICVPVSFIISAVVVHDIPDLISVVGAILVCLSTCGCLFKRP